MRYIFTQPSKTIRNIFPANSFVQSNFIYWRFNDLPNLHLYRQPNRSRCLQIGYRLINNSPLLMAWRNSLPLGFR